VAIIVAVAILFYVRYLPTDQWIVRILLGLQLGGALGNVIDRVNQGYVTDFIKTGIPGFYYIPNYNIADAAIVVGVIGLGIYIIVDDMRKQRAQKSATPETGELSPGSQSE
jgi:signal peptidase II